jgi:hypothetical protein
LVEVRHFIIERRLLLLLMRLHLLRYVVATDGRAYASHFGALVSVGQPIGHSGRMCIYRWVREDLFS